MVLEKDQGQVSEIQKQELFLEVQKKERQVLKTQEKEETVSVTQEEQGSQVSEAPWE